MLVPQCDDPSDDNTRCTFYSRLLGTTDLARDLLFFLYEAERRISYFTLEDRACLHTYLLTKKMKDPLSVFYLVSANRKVTEFQTLTVNHVRW